jgi:hypothetical protein
MVTSLTVLSDRPPTELMERPWPPEQTPPVKTIVCSSDQQEKRAGERKWAITYRPRINSQAIILIIHIRPTNRNPRTIPHIKRIRIRGPFRIPIGIINSNPRERQAGAAIDAENLHRGVLDVDARDGRGDQVVRVEELGLGFATIGALAVPPAGAVAVEVGARAGGDGDVGSGDGDEGARPLFVAECCFALEDYLGLLALA